MMKPYFMLLAITVCLPRHVVAQELMQALSEQEMSEVDARQGIAMNVAFRINAQADGSSVPAAECPDVAGLTGGSSCRLAISLADAMGMWIVMKNYRGILNLNNIRIDASNLPSAWTVHTSGGVNQSPYLAGFDPRGKPAIQLSSGNWAVAYANGPASAAYYGFLNQSAYNEMAVMLDIKKLSAEFDCGASVNAAAGIHVAGCSAATPGWNGVDRVPGYLRNAVPEAAISLRMASGISGSALEPNTPAKIRLDGRLQIYGY
jgi:hypothetical protein